MTTVKILAAALRAGENQIERWESDGEIAIANVHEIITAALDAGLEAAIRKDERARVLAGLIADNLREVERSDESAIVCYPSIVIQDWLSQKSREIESEAAR